MRRSARSVGVVALAVVCSAAAAGCGSGGASHVNAPVTAPSPTSSAVIAPTAYPDPFTGARAADAMMPATASLLAAGLAKDAGWSGDPTSAAAELRAKLTYLLTEHVHLFGMVVVAIDHNGPRAPQTKAAQAGLDANSTALVAEIQDLAKPATAKQSKRKATPTPTPESNSDVADLTSGDFATAWKAHITQLVDYAVAAKDKVSSDASDARHNLEIWGQSAASFLKTQANNKLRSTDVRDALDKYVSGLTDAAESLARQDGKGYDSLRTAASATVDVASVLADGFARAGGLAGKATDEAATARAKLTSLLTEHVDLIVDIAYAGYADSSTGGLQGTGANAARAALDANAKDLAAAFGKAANAKDQAAFLVDWRRHTIDFVDYANAARRNDVSAADKAVAALDAYRTTAGAFFASISSHKLDAGQVAEAFTGHIASLTGDIRALAAFLPATSGADN
jgi:hypothetical protein